MSKKTQQDTKNFEDYLTDAKSILEQLSNPDITLSDSVKLYKDGQLALEEAQKLLDEAKLIVEEAVSK